MGQRLGQIQDSQSKSKRHFGRHLLGCRLESQQRSLLSQRLQEGGGGRGSQRASRAYGGGGKKVENNRCGGHGCMPATGVKGKKKGTFGWGAMEREPI